MSQLLVGQEVYEARPIVTEVIVMKSWKLYPRVCGGKLVMAVQLFFRSINGWENHHWGSTFPGFTRYPVRGICSFLTWVIGMDKCGEQWLFRWRREFMQWEKEILIPFVESFLKICWWMERRIPLFGNLKTLLLSLSNHFLHRYTRCCMGAFRCHQWLTPPGLVLPLQE